MEVRTIARKKNEEALINQDIQCPEVRLLNELGEMVGVVPRDQALSMAASAGLDLVLVNPNPDNPVARIMDYGKFQYEQSKREKIAKKAQKKIEIKEVGLKLTTDIHDFETKVRHAKKFIEEGNRVKVNIRFRGREMAHTSQGYEVMDRFVEAMTDLAEIDKSPRMEGRNMVMYLAPSK